MLALPRQDEALDGLGPAEQRRDAARAALHRALAAADADDLPVFPAVTLAQGGGGRRFALANVLRYLPARDAPVKRFFLQRALFLDSRLGALLSAFSIGRSCFLTAMGLDFHFPRIALPIIFFSSPCDRLSLARTHAVAWEAFARRATVDRCVKARHGGGCGGSHRHVRRDTARVAARDCACRGPSQVPRNT